ncbi:glycosyl transferase family 41-domain-containing protein [Baffinella frigidus]|nr:glycosyl transferase family 41-domain-containing protein [Cryptophyta sp. CCMP2293]
MRVRSGRAAARIVSVLLLLLAVARVGSDAAGGEDHPGADTGCWAIPDRGGPLGDWGPGHPAWAAASDAARLGADSEALHDAGITLLQTATDQTWGIYALAARSLVASLRLAGQVGVARPSALYHLGFAIQSLREHAGGAWRAKARNAFTLATQASPVEGAFEGLAWFYVSNGDSAGALRAYSAGLDARCEPPGFGAVPPGVDRECRVSPTFIYRWWDAVQLSAALSLYQHGLPMVVDALLGGIRKGEPMDMAQAMRCPLPDHIRRLTAEAQARLLLAQAAPHALLDPASLFAFRGGFAHVPLDWSFSNLAPGEGRRVRVGFLSFNFSPARNLNGLVAGVLPRIADARFESICMALYGHHRSDTEHERRDAEAHCTSFVDLGAGGKTDAEVARDVNDMQPHVVVDLIGLIHNHRHSVLLLRPAPLQVVMVYAATTGGPGIDLLLADRTATPPELADLYTERLLFLPGSHFVNNQAGLLPLDLLPASRAEFGLPEGVPLVAAMNAFFKICPEVFQAWMEVLRRVPSAILLLAKYQYFEAAAANLAKAAAMLDVEPSRVVTLNKTASLVDHVRRAGLADLFLDTRTYNAHTLAVDVLWAGVPLVTLPGTALAQRVSASLLVASGLGDTVARSLHDYADIAAALARPARGTLYTKPFNKSNMLTPISCNPQP